MNDFVMNALRRLLANGRTVRGHVYLLIPLLFILFVTIVDASPVHQNESISLENEIGDELELEAVTAIESNRRALSEIKFTREFVYMASRSVSHWSLVLCVNSKTELPFSTFA